MADFVQSANVKSATRTLAEPIADVATFNTIVQSIITDNPCGRNLQIFCSLFF